MKIGFVFPGQGSQFPGMGKKLYDEFRIVKETFEEASDAIKINMVKLCFDSPTSELKITFNAQPAILTVSVAAFRILKEETGIHPEVASGHSLGEYTALHSAGALTFFDAVKVVRKRGELMQECAPQEGSAMVAVIGLPPEEVEKTCEEVNPEEVFPANYNAPDQIVIAGKETPVKKVVERIKEKGGRTIFLNVSAPFHTPFMRKAGDNLYEILTHIHFKKPAFPVIRNVDANLYTAEEEIPSFLAKQVYSAVRWIECVKKMEEMGVNITIEPGPREVLGGLIKKTSDKIKTFKMTEPADIKVIANYLKP